MIDLPDLTVPFQTTPRRPIREPVHPCGGHSPARHILADTASR